MRDTHGFDLNRTERDWRPGTVSAHFYCDGHDPYAGTDPSGEPERMSDRGGRLVRAHY